MGVEWGFYPLCLSEASTINVHAHVSVGVRTYTMYLTDLKVMGTNETLDTAQLQEDVNP